jgi:hypothetical protein
MSSASRSDRALGIQPPSTRSALARLAYRLATNLYVPPFWLPTPPPRTGRSGRLKLEIVTHCWNYSHLLAYQLSSLVLHPPRKPDVRVTVFHCEEDADTSALLDFFARQPVPNLQWNWQALPRQALMRRCIGRNLAALSTTADWVWFTDCDLVFHQGCVDALAALLDKRSDALVYPREERCTALLGADDPALTRDAHQPQLISIDTSRFTSRFRSRATGPLQITHGDVARAMGYCDALPCFLEPAQQWQKAHEDRLFRWLLRTPGTPLEVPGVYRIRHAEKGRYTGKRWSNQLRGAIRRLKSLPQDRR